MKNRQFLNIVSVLFTAAVAASAESSDGRELPTQSACRVHNPNESSVPYCPDSPLLPDNYYPAKAISVSDNMGGSAFINEFVTKVLQAQPDKPPQLILNVREESFDSLITEITKLAPDSMTRERWLSALKRTDGSSWNWQQDIYQSFVDPSTGRPILREVAPYRTRGSGYTSSIFSAVASAAGEVCDVATGPALGLNAGTLKNGHMGGNLEALPGGLCVIGDDHMSSAEWSSFSKEVCSPENTIKAPTNFLAVGHTDEIMTTIKVSNAAAPCDFAVMVASPAAGLEALRKHRDTKAFGSHAKTGSRLFGFPAWRRICLQHLSLRSEEKGSPSTRRRIRSINWWPLTLAPAWAAAERLSASNNWDSIEDCAQMTSAELLAALESNSDLMEYNRAVQEQMDEFKKTIQSRLKERLPQCSPKILDVPNIFSGRVVQDKNGKVRTAEGASYFSGDSFFSNPTNSVQVGKTLLISDPQNEAFKSVLSQQLSAVGIRPDFIDTHFAHQGGGNLHCSTKSISYCRPRPRKGKR